MTIATSKLANPNEPETQGWIGGMRIPQFRHLLESFQERGVDFANVISCEAGSRNLIEVFRDFPRKFTMSICAVSDVCCTFNLSSLGETYLNIKLHKIAQFFREISATFAKKSEPLKPKIFCKALENIYGCNWPAIPLVSVVGSSKFEAVNVHKRSIIITYKKIAQNKPLFQVNRECLLVYPQILMPTVHLSHFQGLSPNVISMIPDHNQVLFSKIVTTASSPLQVIRESFLKVGRKDAYASETIHLYIVKELVATDETFINVVACFSVNMGYCIFQKANEPDKWFVVTDEFKEISENEALIHLYQNLQRIKTSKGGIEFSGTSSEVPSSIEDVRDYYKKWLSIPSINPRLYEALERLNRNEYNKIPADMNSKDYVYLMFYAIYENKWDSIRFLSDNVRNFEQSDCFGKKALHLMIERGAPAETLANFLSAGVSADALDESGHTPLYYAVNANREDVIELLIGKGIDINSPNNCNIINVAYNLGKKDFALTLARKYHARVFGSGILANVSNDPKWGEFFAVSLDQLRQVSNGNEIAFSQSFLNTMLMDESSFICGWEFYSVDCRRLLTESFVNAFKVLSNSSSDHSAIIDEFLRNQYYLHREDLTIIKRHIKLPTSS